MRVLVIEDVPRLADDIAEGLRDQAMAVDVAYDGLAGASKMRVTRYDVIVLDRDLPGLHGDTLCQMLAESSDPAMVLMLTASTTPDDRVAGLSIGADDYLIKPFHFPELVLRVESLARRRPTNRARVLRAGGVELDRRRHVATRAGSELALTAKEFALLEALLRAAPAPMSAEELLEHVWDEHAEPFTKTVQVTVSRLRRKLGTPNIIETIPRVGYRISE